MSVMKQNGEIDPYERITEILGCRWSLAIFDAIGRGITRPSRIEQEYDGLTTKVLHRCLNRLEADGILQKQVYAEIPPRTEYGLTEKGRRFVDLLGNARTLAQDWNRQSASV
jgi:DNA-binding HxlR family transcriptional regulator